MQAVNDHGSNDLHFNDFVGRAALLHEFKNMAFRIFHTGSFTFMLTHPL